uniref:Ig-like domain-containing protein n=1 Tax=Heterorhabditis bacteriophora TaxID=37862 RepID=A0A1I7XA04_HETBA
MPVPPTLVIQEEDGKRLSCIAQRTYTRDWHGREPSTRRNEQHTFMKAIYCKDHYISAFLVLLFPVLIKISSVYANAADIATLIVLSFDD